MSEQEDKDFAEAMAFDVSGVVNAAGEVVAELTQEQLTVLFINQIAEEVYEENATWYKTVEGEPKPFDEHFNVGTLVALAHSELSEALEGYRKGIMDTHLTHRPMIEVELADAVLRCMGIARILNLDLGGALVEKRAYNLLRADHKRESQSQPNGKKF